MPSISCIFYINAHTLLVFYAACICCPLFGAEKPASFPVTGKEASKMKQLGTGFFLGEVCQVSLCALIFRRLASLGISEHTSFLKIKAHPYRFMIAGAKKIKFSHHFHGDFERFAPILDTMGAICPSCRQQLSPDQIQIRKPDQRKHLGSILRDPFVAHLTIAKLTFHDPEHMLNLGPDR